MALASLDDGSTPAQNFPSLVRFVWKGIADYATDDSFSDSQKLALAAIGNAAHRDAPAKECKAAIVSAIDALVRLPRAQGPVGSEWDIRPMIVSSNFAGEETAARGCSRSDQGVSAAPEGAQG